MRREVSRANLRSGRRGLRDTDTRLSECDVEQM